jgi:hypothetical protein
MTVRLCLYHWDLLRKRVPATSTSLRLPQERIIISLIKALDFATVEAFLPHLQRCVKGLPTLAATLRASPLHAFRGTNHHAQTTIKTRSRPGETCGAVDSRRSATAGASCADGLRRATGWPSYLPCEQGRMRTASSPRRISSSRQPRPTAMATVMA